MSVKKGEFLAHVVMGMYNQWNEDEQRKLEMRRREKKKRLLFGWF